jgi:hypothetical protein
MRVNFSLEQIFGRNPHEVVQLFRSQGLAPERPYRTLVSFSGITIEQDGPSNQVAVVESVEMIAENF